MLVSRTRKKTFSIEFSSQLNLDATKKRYHAEKNLSKNLQEKDRIEREFVKKREKVSRIS